jgi:hypothetical protein
VHEKVLRNLAVRPCMAVVIVNRSGVLITMTAE